MAGEAARSVSPELRGRYPHIPWRGVIGTRDRLIHGDADVNLDIIWVIVTRDLPPLVEALRKLLAQEEDRPGD